MTENNAEAPGARPRFLTLQGVAEVLNVSKPQAYAWVRSGDLPAIKVGGRGQWRVETSALEGHEDLRWRAPVRWPRRGRARGSRLSQSHLSEQRATLIINTAALTTKETGPHDRGKAAHRAGDPPDTDRETRSRRGDPSSAQRPLPGGGRCTLRLPRCHQLRSTRHTWPRA